jgi:uncharacterized integral membrane protein
MIFLKILMVLGVLLVLGGAFVGAGLQNTTMEEFNHITPYCYLSAGIGLLLILVTGFLISMPADNNCIRKH